MDPAVIFSGADTPPRDTDSHNGMIMMDFDSKEPDSMELLMMGEDVLPTEGAYFHCCHKSGGGHGTNFHEKGYVGTGELDRMLNEQTPTPHLAVNIEY